MNPIASSWYVYGVSNCKTLTYLYGPLQELLELLSGVIGLLRNLRILEINLYVDPSSLSNDPSQYHDEWVTLQAWTGPCPTLIECKMPSQLHFVSMRSSSIAN